MTDNHIANPRPLFQDDPKELKEDIRRLKLGGQSAGIVIDVSKKGLTINGYYKSFNEREVYYANVRDCVEITWEELEKVRKARKKRATTKRKTKTLEPDKVEEKIDKEYLKSLPVVTINKAKYYIDAEKRQRRPFERPHIVYNY